VSDRVASDIGPYSIVPEWVTRAGVSDRAVRLFALLARYADRSDEAYPGRRTLAASLRASIDSVDRATKELVMIGAVVVKPRRDQFGDQTSNLYQLRFSAPQTGEVAAEQRPPSRSDATTGGRTAAATVAAPVRHRTIPIGTKVPVSEETGVRTATVLTFPCIGPGASSWALTAEQLTEWQQVYPGLDVLGEFRRALAWLNATPHKRKTARGMPRFLVAWLNRAIAGAGARVARRAGRTGASAPCKYAEIEQRDGLERAS